MFPPPPTHIYMLCRYASIGILVNYVAIQIFSRSKVQFEWTNCYNCNTADIALYIALYVSHTILLEMAINLVYD